MENKLSNEEKDQLISLVKENPLYDSTSKGNKDNLIKENTWINITQAMK